MIPRVLDRGSFERSTLTAVNFQKEFTYSTIDYSEFSNIYGDYFIFHTQAPTTSSSLKHPFVSNKGSLLWHNGILKESEINKLQCLMKIQEKWDTALLAEIIDLRGYIELSDIDGSFACVRAGSDFIHIFRNEIAPLNIKGANISSVPFDESKELPANVVFEFNGKEFLGSGITFRTQSLPYFLG